VRWNREKETKKLNRNIVIPAQRKKNQKKTLNSSYASEAHLHSKAGLNFTSPPQSMAVRNYGLQELMYLDVGNQLIVMGRLIRLYSNNFNVGSAE